MINTLSRTDGAQSQALTGLLVPGWLFVGSLGRGDYEPESFGAEVVRMRVLRKTAFFIMAVKVRDPEARVS